MLVEITLYFTHMKKIQRVKRLVKLEKAFAPKTEEAKTETNFLFSFQKFLLVVF
jgi:hypothetical protein